MHQIFETHLAEVYRYYETLDHSLAMRRLLDCAIETQDPQIFRETLRFCEWLEQQEANTVTTTADIQVKAYELLEKIRNAGVKKADTSDSKILQLTDVGKTYRKSGFKVKDLRFDLHLKQITGLVGENGNGKTTLLKLLAAELKPDTGTISYPFVQDASDSYALKTKLIYIEQRIPRWYGSLMDNLQFALSHYQTKSDENILWAEMMVARLGLRPYRHLSWNRISSGYRTRFEIAKTLLRKPKILLLDEPLANLDIISQQTMLQDLKYMANSISAPFGMILSSQHIYEVEKVSDKIIFIKNGVPQYQDQQQAATSDTRMPLIIEIEVDCSRTELQTALAGTGLEKTQYNGGVYVLHFSAETSSAEVLGALAQHHVPTHYYRNISQSSRRFFIS